MPKLFELAPDAATWLVTVFTDPGDDQAFHLDTTWESTAGAGFACGELVRLAQETGFIVTPAAGVTVKFEYLADIDGNGGYRWLLEYGDPDPAWLAPAGVPAWMQLASPVGDLRDLTRFDLHPGVPSALDLLGQAVEAANGMAAALQRFVAAAAAVPF